MEKGGEIKVTGTAKIAKVNGEIWVTISSDETSLKKLEKEAKSHGFKAELDLSWSPTLFLKQNKINVDILKKALEAKGLEVTIL